MGFYVCTLQNFFKVRSSTFPTTCTCTYGRVTYYFIDFMKVRAFNLGNIQQIKYVYIKKF